MNIKCIYSGWGVNREVFIKISHGQKVFQLNIFVLKKNAVSGLLMSPAVTVYR